MKPSALNHPPEDPPSLEHAMATVASAMAEPSRVSMLCALMDGQAWTATELSAAADIAPSTASVHLAKLVCNGLISCLSQGRHRYYRLADGDIAAFIENLMAVSHRTVPQRPSTTPTGLRQARTCYDHLAGNLAVGIYQFMADNGWLNHDCGTLTDAGRDNFATIGIPLAPCGRRKISCACLDWSERRYHLGGYAGAALLSYGVQKQWLITTPGFRDVTVTAAGEKALFRLFQVPVAQ